MPAASKHQTAAPIESVVRLEREGRVALIIIDNPPVNAASWAVRSGVAQAIATLAADAAIDTCVLIGAHDTFVAGADIREFGKPLADPQMPDVIAAIEACPKPVLAAIDGACLGGGFELALGCDARIAALKAVVGLPEVRLGIIPGSGGTQRLPRLVGVSAAIEMITSGRHVKMPEASRLGIVDQIAEGDLRSAAIAFAHSLDGRKRRLRDVPLPHEPAERIEAAAAAAQRQPRGRPIREAVDAIRATENMPFEAALAMEREVFHRLRASEGAAAMRHLFFAERAATRFLELKDVKSQLLSRVGVVGAGTMGSGIAASMLAVGYPVVLVEQDAGALQAAISRIRNIEARNVSNGRVSADKSEQRLARLQPATDLSALADVDLVIEAVFEDMDVKQKLLRKITPTLPARTIIASNTSYLNLDTLAAASARPENVIGLHFFAPANVMRLLEVVKGEKTAPDVLVTALGLARNLDKVAVVSGVGDGFIGNRIYSAYRTQCEFMVEEGAMPEQVDAALEAFGLAMGPFAVGDLSGLDIAWRNRNRQAAARNPAHRYCKIADMLCEAGRLGRKTGAGWYRYPAGAKKGEPDEFVVRLIAEVSAAAGIMRRSFTPEQIQMRALAAMVNEAALALEDGVARLASDIDLVLVHGYGFPAQRGGPMFWASRRPQAEIDAAIEALASATGPEFRRGCLDLMPKSPEA